MTAPVHLITRAGTIDCGDRITFRHHLDGTVITADVVVAPSACAGTMRTIKLDGMPFTMGIGRDHQVRVDAGTRELRAQCDKCGAEPHSGKPWAVTPAELVPPALLDHSNATAMFSGSFGPGTVGGLCAKCLDAEYRLTAPKDNALMLASAVTLRPGDVIAYAEDGAAETLHVRATDASVSDDPHRLHVFVEEYPLPLTVHKSADIVLYEGRRHFTARCIHCSKKHVEYMAPVKDLITPLSALGCGLAAVDVSTANLAVQGEFSGCCDSSHLGHAPSTLYTEKEHTA